MATEMLDFCAQGYWAVLPYQHVRQWQGLRISPMGVIPQRDRRPRLIVDYSFSGVNEDTIPLAPKEAMQFGRALQRVMATIVHSDPRYGPVYLSKIDIADGFYRVWLHIADIAKLGVVLPTAPGEPPVVAFPLTLPMGWVESPPYFTAITETACDLANANLSRHHHAHLPVHRLEAVAATPPPEAATTPAPAREGLSLASRLGHSLRHKGRPPVAKVDVYVDDFLLLAQTAPQRQRVMRTTLHAIDSVLRPLTPTEDPIDRKEPASVKKMLKGEACWSTTKRILGWDLDTVASTINLPAHCLARLYELLDMLLPPRKRLAIRTSHRLLGELQSMALALPGARGLFSALQHTLGRADRNRVRITAEVRAAADNVRAIADALQQRPTRLQELVHSPPAFHGACDACQHGMGGVWFPDLPASTAPILWHSPFPRGITTALVTSDNPNGALSISDLELAALIAHKDVLATHVILAERTIWMATDNRAALAWSTKGSSTSVSARAHLLRMNAMHQRHHRYVATHSHIPGTANVMADDASRLWHLNDTELLTHFLTHYPQACPWELHRLQPSTNSRLIGALSRQQPANASRLDAPMPVPPPGASGQVFVTTYPLPPCHPTPSPSCKSSPNVCAPEPSAPVADPSALARWKTRSAPWGRRMSGWGPRTLV